MAAAASITLSLLVGVEVTPFSTLEYLSDQQETNGAVRLPTLGAATTWLWATSPPRLTVTQFGTTHLQSRSAKRRCQCPHRPRVDGRKLNFNSHEIFL